MEAVHPSGGGRLAVMPETGSKRTALSAELLLSQSRTDAATSLVAVYKALGAGWAVSESAAVTAQR